VLAQAGGAADAAGRDRGLPPAPVDPDPQRTAEVDEGPDLVQRNFNAEAPNRLRVSDFTYDGNYSGRNGRSLLRAPPRTIAEPIDS